MLDPTICIHGGLVLRTTRGAAGVVRVRLQGELDAFSQAALRHLLRRLDLHSTRHLDLNLSAISFCDSSGCIGLLSFSERASHAGFTVRMHSATSQLRWLAELVEPETAQVFEE